MECSLKAAAAALLLVVSVALPSTGCERPAPTSAKNPYDVLLVTLDTTRADYLGCYEPQRAGNTPNFDALAADGVQFMTCYSASAVTPVSHASILSGLYPFQHGLRVIYAQSGCQLPEDVPYLPEVLKNAGWQTAAFLSAFTVSEFYCLDRAFDTFDSGLTRKADELISRQPDGIYDWPVAANQRRSDKTTDAALGWLGRLDRRRPFCLWVHYWDPHDAHPELPETVPPREFLYSFLRTAERTRAGEFRAVYEGEVAYLDRQFGRLIEKLKGMGRYEDTIIVVVADHGEGLGEHDWWWHSILYEEQIRVPLIVRIPGWPTGKRIPSLVRTVDVYPTILDALGIEDRTSIEGRTLRGLIHGVAGPARTAYADALNQFDLNSRVLRGRPQDGNVYCVTDGVWKLLWRPDRPDDSELYNLVNDPDELQNLFDAAGVQVQRLRASLKNLEPFRTTPFPARGLPQDESAMRALESLGYVGGSPTSVPASGRPLPDAPNGDAPTPFTGSDPNSTSREPP